MMTSGRFSFSRSTTPVRAKSGRWWCSRLAQKRRGAAQRSPAAVKKQTTGLTEDGLPVHSFHSLLADLATLVRNTIITAITPNHPLTGVTKPTPIQHKAFTLLGVAA
jgi:hypothetical protein